MTHYYKPCRSVGRWQALQWPFVYHGKDTCAFARIGSRLVSPKISCLIYTLCFPLPCLPFRRLVPCSIQSMFALYSPQSWFLISPASISTSHHDLVTYAPAVTSLCLSPSVSLPASTRCNRVTSNVVFIYHHQSENPDSPTSRALHQVHIV